MKRALQIALIALLAASALAAAAVPSRHWSRVRAALSKGLPKTALAPVDSVITDAERRHAWAEAIRAVALKVALEAGIQGNKPEEKITRMQAAIETAPREMRPLMEAILADWYWQYFQQNRWRFAQRTATAAEPGADFTTWDLPRLYAEIDRHFSRALAAAPLLRRTPIAGFDALFDRGNAPDPYRPTVYDFVAHKALEFYGSSEQGLGLALPDNAFVLQAASPVLAPREEFVRWSIAAPDTASPVLKGLRLYQELLRFHAGDRDPAAWIDADLWRLEFARRHAVGEARDARYVAALEHVIDHDSGHELSSRALHILAMHRYQQDDWVESRKLAQRGLDRFPASIGGRRCFNLIATIEAKSLGVSASDNVWNSPAPTLQVTYRNLDRVYFRLVPYDFEETIRGGRVPGNIGYADRGIPELLERPAAREWSAEVPPTSDYKLRTERLPVPAKLPAGSYYLVSSARADFAWNENSIAAAPVWISDLALVLRDGRPNGFDGFVLDALDGAPVEGVDVKTWMHDNAHGRIVAGPTARTDRNGMFHVAGNDRIAALLAATGKRRIGLTDNLHSYRSWKEPAQPQTLFFTDRAIYRPGQEIQYKGLCVLLDDSKDDYTTLAARSVRVTLSDPNGREIAHRDHVTNALGSFSGTFTAPGDGLLGTMQLAADSGPSGATEIRVEEYKRPKFMVTLDAPRAAPRLAGTVELTGRALAYTGAAIDGAKVEWRVMRDVRWPMWWDGYGDGRSRYAGSGTQSIAHGTATTDAEGRFTVAFTAVPDSSVPPEQEPNFQFSVTTAVTDGAGETRSASRTVSVGYTALAASLSAAEWLEAANPTAIAVRTTTLDGTPQQATGTLTVVRLHEPERVDRASEAETDYEPDARGVFVRRRGDKRIPGVTVDPMNPAQWAEGEVVAERSVRTDTLGADTLTLRLAAGHYRAHFVTRDRFGKTVTARIPLRVLDPRASSFGLRVRDLFAARDASVEVGDGFLGLWGTGYETAHAFVEVECNGRMLQSYWVAGTQAVIRQRATESMRGGFTVRVTRVAENRAYLHERYVTVPWSNKRLDVRWEHFVSKLEPGKRDTWTAVVSGPDATRASAEMVATLYDASLDAFAPLSWPGFSGFRINRDQRNPRYTVNAAPLRDVRTSWSTPSRDGTLEYRSLPSGLLWGDYTYGVEDLPNPDASEVFDVPGGGPSPGRGLLAGHVRDKNGKPLPYANVVAIGSKRGAMTDEHGQYVIRNLAPGTVQVKAQMLGYAVVTRTATIEAGRTTFLDFRLGGVKVQLVEVRVGTRAAPRERAVDNLLESKEEYSTLGPATSGIVAADAAVHVRGGRSGELKFQVGGIAPATPKLDLVTARRNLRETAFFYPHLVTNANGEVRIEFTMPEALTEWRFLAFAHDTRLRSGLLTDRAVTAKDLMVQPNPPRFLREGDELEFTVKVTNQAATAQRGRVRLRFTNAVDDSPADVALANRAPEQPLDVPARSSRTYAWRIRVPEGAGVLRYTAVASTAKLSDGEEGLVPVLSRRVLVTESLPLPIRGPATKAFDFERLRRSAESTTLRHQSVTVQVVSNPAWYAVMALPYLMEYPYECTEQTFNRFYANALARHIAASHPSIRATFDRWRDTPALDSPLEKNDALTSMLATETPWLRQAKSESQARRNVGILFDRGRLDRETQRTVEKLQAMQLPGGMWPWFPGGSPNEYITLYITTGFGRLRHLGVDLSVQAPIRSLEALDAWSDHMYREILRHGNRDTNHLSPTIALYLYGRSFFLKDRPVPPNHREALDYWLGQARTHWLKVSDRQTRGHLALGLARFGDRESAKAIMRSVKEYSVSDEEMGMFWRDTEYSWWWYRAPIETQALMIEAFDEVMGDSATVEDCRVWLLKQKQTQDWKTTKATADAVYALLLRGTDILTSKALVEVTLGDSLVRPDKVEAGTGFYETRFAAARVRPEMGRIEVAKSDPGVAWGSVHWQYLEDIEKVTPYAGTPLRLVKTLFVRKPGRAGLELRAIAGPLHPGDELIVRIELRTDRDMEYVHMEDARGSGSEPVNVLSGYRYQDGLAYYEETRDAATHFFIDYLPKGTYVFEYPLRIQHRGRYTSGVASIQCMYAPEFNSHSASVPLMVE